LYKGSNNNFTVIGLQSRSYGRYQKSIIKRLNLKIAVQSDETMNYLKELGFKQLYKISSGVDLGQFAPIKDINKINELKVKYRLPLDKKIILHIGHIKEERNILELGKLQEGINGAQAVVVGSTSTLYENEVKEKLMKKNVIIIDQYLSSIEELYQVADIYIFPVESKSNCIEMPLSIVEALACGIKVISLNKVINNNLVGLKIIESKEKLLEETKQFISIDIDKNLIADEVKKWDWNVVFDDYFFRSAKN
jgi:glycosyltransferase involved in cell wall biosynthesis